MGRDDSEGPRFPIAPELDHEKGWEHRGPRALAAQLCLTSDLG